MEVLKVLVMVFCWVMFNLRRWQACLCRQHFQLKLKPKFYSWYPISGRNVIRITNYVKVIMVMVVGLLSDNELRSLKSTGGPRLSDIRHLDKPRFRTLEIIAPNPSFVRRIRTFVPSWRTNISSYRAVALSNWVPKCIFCPLNSKNADPSGRAV